tara:strand:+ start:211 stop:369 length:159 start_codon:yes stop_codon:yes gene_type:complete
VDQVVVESQLLQQQEAQVILPLNHVTKVMQVVQVTVHQVMSKVVVAEVVQVP